ncbi:MAG: hypothetical protein AAF687_12080, partial [Pseudomonadota bacterium]
VNNRIEQSYRREASSRRNAIIAREKIATQTYNFFALPPARGRFCDAMLALSQDALLNPPTDAEAFALANFAYIEAPFEDFFNAYEQYERDSMAWDIKYGEEYGPSQAGWVAVQKARAEGNPNVPIAGVSSPASTLAAPTAATSTVTDPTTGAQVPVVPVQQGVVSQPVVEPIATKPKEEGDGPQ